MVSPRAEEIVHMHKGDAMSIEPENEPGGDEVLCPLCAELARADTRRGRWVPYVNLDMHVIEVPYFCPHGHEFVVSARAV
jgi:hypothetical protein